MGIKIHFLILCTILSQVIGALSKENIEESSNLHLRKKRLIYNTTHRMNVVKLSEIPHIVNLRINGDLRCGASILTQKILLTAAHCVKETNVTYSVLAGSSKRNQGRYHAVKRIFKYPEYNEREYLHDLALVVIYPPIRMWFSSNRKATFYNGPLHSGIVARFSGWGCIRKESGNILVFPNELHSIWVPILDQEKCHDVYRSVAQIGEQEICTANMEEEKGSCEGDSGGPLTINGQLAGVMSWTVDNIPNRRFPDVFMNLAYPPYRAWITSTIQSIRESRG